MKICWEQYETAGLKEPYLKSLKQYAEANETADFKGLEDWLDGMFGILTDAREYLWNLRGMVQALREAITEDEKEFIKCHPGCSGLLVYHDIDSSGDIWDSNNAQSLQESFVKGLCLISDELWRASVYLERLFRTVGYNHAFNCKRDDGAPDKPRLWFDLKKNPKKHLFFLQRNKFWGGALPGDIPYIHPSDAKRNKKVRKMNLKRLKELEKEYQAFVTGKRRKKQ